MQMAQAQPRALIAGIIGAAGALAAAAYFVTRRRRQDANAADHPGHGAMREGEGPVRSAGPEGMRSSVRREWTRVDEASDESFPASDPPATY